MLEQSTSFSEERATAYVVMTRKIVNMIEVTPSRILGWIRLESELPPWQKIPIPIKERINITPMRIIIRIIISNLSLIEEKSYGARKYHIKHHIASKARENTPTRATIRKKFDNVEQNRSMSL